MAHKEPFYLDFNCLQMYVRIYLVSEVTGLYSTVTDLGVTFLLLNGVKSGIFGQTAIFGQPPCLFHSSIIGIKNKITKQTVKILMRHLDIHCFQTCVRIYLVSEFT